MHPLNLTDFREGFTSFKHNFDGHRVLCSPFKGNPKYRDTSWPGNTEIFLFHVALSVCQCLYYRSAFYFLALTLGFLGCSHAHFLPLKSRKRPVCDIIDTCATHDSLVHDLQDTDCETLTGSPLGCVCTTSEHF